MACPHSASEGIGEPPREPPLDAGPCRAACPSRCRGRRRPASSQLSREARFELQNGKLRHCSGRDAYTEHPPSSQRMQSRFGFSFRLTRAEAADVDLAAVSLPRLGHVDAEGLRDARRGRGRRGTRSPGCAGSSASTACTRSAGRRGRRGSAARHQVSAADEKGLRAMQRKALWGEKDSNLRRRSQQIYSLPPLTTRESPRSDFRQAKVAEPLRASRNGPASVGTPSDARAAGVGQYPNKASF